MNRWPVHKLSEFIEIEHGFAFKGDHFAEERTGLVVVTPGNFMIGGGFKKEKLKWYSTDGPLENDYILKPGDLIVTMTDLSKAADTLGYSAIVPNDDLTYLHNQRIGLVRVLRSDCLDKAYLYWLMRSGNYRGQVIATATGTTVHHTAPERLKQIEFALPSLKIQRRIAGILCALDDKIEINRRINHALEEMAQAIYKHTFVDFEPLLDGEFVVSEAGEIPAGWDIKPLSDVCNLTMGLSPKSKYYNEDGEGLPFHQGVTDFGTRYPIHRRYCTITKRTANRGDILISVRAPVGRINIADRKLVIGRGVAAISRTDGSNSFQLYQLKDLFQKEDSMGSGTIYASVTKKDLQKLRLVVPSEEIIQAFEELVSIWDEQIATNVKQNNMLRDIRDYLLAKLLSGELKVSPTELRFREAPAAG